MAQELQQPQQTALAETGTHHLDAMTLVGQAVANGAQVEQVDKLIELVKFNDDREALRAFNKAFTEAQAEFPSIRKTKKAHNSLYAPLSSEVAQMQPVLSKYGFSFRHEVSENDNSSVTVRCILAHRDGHSESATLTGPADTSGSKNNIQAIGSSVTYLRRYTFEAVTGLVTADQDDDGNAVGRKPTQRVSQKQADQIQARLEETETDRGTFLRVFGKKANCGQLESINDIPASVFDFAIQVIDDNYKKKQERAQ